MTTLTDSVTPTSQTTAVTADATVNPTGELGDDIVPVGVQEAAEVTGYNVQYLRRLLRAGKLEAIKIGQIWLVNLASLQAYFSRAISSNDLRCGPKGCWQPPF